MATPWWAKVSLNYYKKPSDLGAAVAPRARNMAAVVADTRLRDEPQVAGAFMNANVPMSLAMRADAEYQIVKARAKQGIMGNAGMPEQQGRVEQKAADVDQKREEQTAWGFKFDPTASDWDNFWSVNSQLVNKALDVPKQAATGAMETLGAAFSPLTVPVALGRANETASGTFGELSDTQKNMLQLGAVAKQNGNVKAAQGAALLGILSPDPISTGVTGLLGITDLSKGQQDDMRRNGYDPTSFVSRYAWYYDSMEAGQKAVADSDVRHFSQEYEPTKVQAVREIITSKALNDGNFDALSPQAQAFVQGVQSDQGDPRDKELFEKMSKSSTLQLGSVVADGFGIERGTEGSQVVSALGDLALYWFADPVAGAVKGLNAARTAERGFSAGSIASAENKLLALSKPGDVTSAPAHAAGKSFDQLLDVADQIHHLTTAKMPTPGTQAMAINDAAKLLDRFRIEHPDMMGHLDVVTRMREGKLDLVSIKSDDELAAAMKAAQDGKPFTPYVFANPDKPGRSVWSLARGEDGKATQESLNYARAAVVNRMSNYIWGEAIATGRPLQKGIALLPGQVSFNRKVRAAVMPIRDALLRTDSSVYKALDPAKGHVVNFDGTFDKAVDQFVGDTAGGWNRQNYTQKWAPTMEKILSRFDSSYTGKVISFNGPDSLESYRRFVVSMFPRHHAYAMAIKWAKGSPAERMAQWRQTVDAFVETAGFKSDPIAREITDVLTKGVTPKIGQTYRVGPNEVYTAEKADNTINAEGHDIAAAVWPYQLSDGVTLPNFRMIRQLQQRTGVLSAVTGLFNSRLLSAPTAVWKVGKVGNPANMGRQAGELYGISGLEQGAKHTLSTLNARRWVAHETVAGRLDKNVTTRAANLVYKQANGNDLAALNKMSQTGDWTAYRGKLVELARSAGADDREAAALANLSEGIKFDDLVQLSGGSKTSLAMAGPLDALRRVRLEWMRRTGVKDPTVDTSFHQFLDQEFVDGLTKSAMGELGASADQALMLAGGSVADELASAAEKAIGGVPARVPNSREWLGARGDSGAQNWFREFDSRQTDDLGQHVMRALAIEARAPKGGALLSPAEVINADRAAAGLQPIFPSSVRSARDIANYLIRDAAEGEGMRNNAMRLFYNDDGSRAVGQVQLNEAIDRAAQAQLRDAARHMGAGSFDDAGKPTFNAGYDDMLEKMALGKRVTLDDLHKIDNDARPAAISSSLYVPAVGKGDKRSIVNLASKLYSFTVARPLQRLAIQPEFIANRNIAYRSLEPAFEELTTRGFTHQQAAAFLENTASRYAVNATFRYTDQTMERSFFSEATENFLMFQRASEDFIKRFMRVTSANPAILSRAYLLMEAGIHSGMIYPNTSTDDDGNAETHLVFTFPGSGLLARAVQETGRSLGWNDTDLIVKPLYSSMSSQVRYVNPSLSNPLGFSTSPLIGMPMRIARTLFPEADKGITNVLGKLEGGGDTFFAEQSIFQSILPTPLARLVPAITQEDHDGQLASAIRNAFVYYGSAGLLPGNNASPDEIEEAQDAIRGMATNQLIWRAVVGAFSPWAPQYKEPEGTGLPEASVIDQAMGINSLRGEWFEILKQMSEKHGGGSEAFAAASVEWLRRHPQGDSILNPQAMQVGATRAPGTAAEAGSVFSGPELTQWMMENKGWIKDNNAVAYYLLPGFAEAQFSATGMRQQLRNDLRVHKDTAEFYKDVRYTIGAKEFFDRLKTRGAALAGGANPQQVYRDFDDWEKAWRVANPATAAEMDRRQDPNYVHAELAPALERLVESNKAPAGVRLDLAKAVWTHYSDYRTKYNETISGDKGKYDRAHINKVYRNTGDEMFLGTPAEDLWKAMNVYEGGN